MIVRGLRAVSDSRRVPDGVDESPPRARHRNGIHVPAEHQYTYISSRLIKEVFTLGGEITGLVPPIVEEKLRAKQKANKK